MKSFVSTTPRRTLLRLPPGDARRAIAVLTPNYGLERVSYMLPLTGYRFVQLAQLPLRRLERRGSFLEQTPWVAGPRVDLVHSFNQVVVNRPFAVTVEMELPRYLGAPPAWQRRFGLKRLASADCRGIWPLSEAAATYIKRRFARDGFPELAAKIEVFRGAIAPVPDADATHPADRDDTGKGPLKLLFVGGDGLRKGLGPTLAAVRAARARGSDVTLTVIGNPTATCYLVPGVTFATAPVVAELAQDWVTHHATLDNRAVRALMGTHDVLVFPTMDESLGWVPCEAALSGMPTITTDVFALPELVRDGETGWLIDVPLNEDRRWAHVGMPDAARGWDAVQDHLVERLAVILSEIASDRTRIARYGAAARGHIAALYGIDAATAHLEQLYARAVGG